MSVVAEAEPQVVSAAPGRLRLHLTGWSGVGQRQVEAQLRALPGVERAQANSLTGNVLVTYDPHQTGKEAIVTAARTLLAHVGDLRPEPAAPPAKHERHGATVRARIAVRGLDRNPHLAQRVVDLLQQRHGVRALANPLTGRVLVEFDHGAADLDDLIALVADVELPETPGEDRPVDPLDPQPLVQSIARTIGAAVGVALIAIQQLPQIEEPPVGSAVAVQVAGVLGIVRGFPIVRNGLRKLLGPNIADLALSLPNILALALSNSPVGLGVTGVESVRLLSEVQTRRAAYERYSARVDGSAAATPGAVVRIETGERAPL
ncbi:MAG TPA: haloacid dehalogenase, partial [Ktedonobacterales bacterium]|nr:haloacid dehalogenase [Ktedonobacterales bacterium]